MVQTRNANGEIKEFHTIEEALAHSRKDSSVWKISFKAQSGERIRIVREQYGWTYESIDGKRH